MGEVLGIPKISLTHFWPNATEIGNSLVERYHRCNLHVCDTSWSKYHACTFFHLFEVLFITAFIISGRNKKQCLNLQRTESTSFLRWPHANFSWPIPCVYSCRPFCSDIWTTTYFSMTSGEEVKPKQRLKFQFQARHWRLLIWCSLIKVKVTFALSVARNFCVRANW